MTIGRKFALWALAIMLVVTGVSVYLFYASELREESSKLEMFGRMAGHVIEESLITFMQKRDTAGLNSKLADLQKSTDTISGILLLNKDGVVRAGTEKKLIGRKFSLHEAGCRECHEQGHKGLLAAGNGKAYRWAAPIVNKPACYACHPPSAKNNGVLIIDFTAAEFQQHVRRELVTGFFIFASSLFLVGVVMIALSRALVTRRLDRMGAAIKAFQDGDVAVRAPVEGRDEITKLETGFNEMARAITTREREKDELVRTIDGQLRFFQVLIDTIPMPVFYKDVHGVYLGYNKAFEEFLGLPKDRLIGKTVYDAAPKELADKYREMDRELFDHPGVQVYEYSVKHADGTVHEVIFNKATFTDAEGKVAGLVGAMPDITERKRIEEALKAREAQLAESQRIARIGSWERDLITNRVVWSDELYRIFGYAPKEVEPTFEALLKAIHPDDRGHFQKTVKEAIAENKPYAVDYRMTLKNGDVACIHAIGEAVYDGSGRPVLFRGTAQDVTAQQAMEEALKESEERYRTLAETAHDAIFVVNRRGYMEYINQYAAEQLKRRPEEIIGKRRAELFPREMAEWQDGNMQTVFQNGEPVYVEEKISLDGREAWLSTRLVPFRRARGEVDAVLGIARDITERKRLEQMLAQSEGHLRAIIAAEPECVKLIASDGALLEMNPAGLAMIEADSFEQVSGQQVSSLVVPEHRQAFGALVRKAFRGESGALEFEILGLKGTRRWLETHTAPLRNAQGNIFALLGVTRDISGRKKAEQVIQRNYDTQSAINSMLRIFLEDLPLGEILKQTLDIILSIPWLSFESKGAIFLVEGAPDKLVMKAQKGLSEDLTEVCELVPFGTCLCGRAAAEGTVQFADTLDDRHEIRYEGITPHGHYCVPILFSQRVLGVINMYLSVGHRRDEKEIEFLNAIANAVAGIVQRKRAEEERERLIVDIRHALNTVSRSHKEWQDTFDSITDMISIIDRDFTIVKANRAFSGHFGLHPRDVLNRKCYEVFHGAASPVANCPHVQTLDAGKPASEDLLDPKTNKIFRVSTFPYYSPEGEIIGSIHIARDITDDKEKEMRLNMSERLAALGQMASGIAHEINNPLASISGCSEGLLSRVRKGQCDPALFESYLAIIQEEVFRCKSITTAMLSFVRKTTYEKKDITLNDLLDKTLEIIGFQGRLKNVDIVKRYHEKSPVVRGNEGELRQVFIAVITNALDSMDDKGALTLETAAHEGGADVRISDSGEGIAPENLTKIFDPFFTTKAQRGGTGLGLSIARKIVANHSGTIDAASEPGKGTTFRITLPR